MHHTLSPKIRADRKKPGGSNAGKYAGVKEFAGPAGGAPAGTYPINTRARAISALGYAHNAPNPAGIRRAVHEKYPSLGKISDAHKKLTAAHKKISK